MSLRVRSKLGSEQRLPVTVTPSAGQQRKQAGSKPKTAQLRSRPSKRQLARLEPAFEAFSAEPAQAPAEMASLELHTPHSSHPDQTPPHPPRPSLLARRNSSARLLTIDTNLDCEPDWATEFSPECQTSAFVASQLCDRSPSTATAGKRSTARGRRCADQPEEEEAVLIQASELAEQVLPAWGESGPPASSARGQPRRAHPLTTVACPGSGWDFERLFSLSSRRAGRVGACARADGGTLCAGGGARDDEERRRRRAADRLQLIASHFDSDQSRA